MSTSSDATSRFPRLLDKQTTPHPTRRTTEWLGGALTAKSQPSPTDAGNRKPGRGSPRSRLLSRATF